MRHSPPTKLKGSERRFSVASEITISVHTEVVAKTAKEALKIAMNRPVMGLCHQCASGDPEQEWVTSGELDSEPSEVRELLDVTDDVAVDMTKRALRALQAESRAERAAKVKALRVTMKAKS